MKRAKWEGKWEVEDILVINGFDMVPPWKWRNISSSSFRNMMSEKVSLQKVKWEQSKDSFYSKQQRTSFQTERKWQQQKGAFWKEGWLSKIWWEHARKSMAMRHNICQNAAIPKAKSWKLTHTNTHTHTAKISKHSETPFWFASKVMIQRHDQDPCLMRELGQKLEKNFAMFHRFQVDWKMGVVWVNGR